MLDLLFALACVGLLVCIASLVVNENDWWPTRKLGNTAGRHHRKPTKRKH